ncbi:MAG: glycosyltransferase [Candidatus Aureabacteria bacterium]|nr:glycosyltransferase [Candidatus Auribacterota bacterium]
MRKKPKILCLILEQSSMSLQSFSAFEKLDCIVESYKIKSNVMTEGGTLFNYGDFIEKLLTFLPDILFVVNVNGLDAFGGIKDICREKNIKIASWFIDNPFYSYDIWKVLRDDDNCYFFLWDEHYMLEMDAYHHKIYHLPQAASLDNFYPRELSSEEVKKFGSKLSFVGNLGTTYLAGIVESFKKSYCNEDTNVEKWLMEAAQLAIEKKLIDVKEILYEMNKRSKILKLDVDDENKLFSARKIFEAMMSTILRISVINQLFPNKIAVWGNREWQESIPPEYYNGPALYVRDLPRIYCATEMNIDISRFQQRRGTNQRIFDVPACGGFLITDYKKEIEDLFEKDEIVFYRSVEELLNLIEFYKNKPDLRKLIAKRARKRVASYHTYEKRMQAIIETIAKGDQPTDIMGTTSQKEITAWKHYFTAKIKKFKGEVILSVDLFKKASSLSVNIKKYADDEIKKIEAIE